MGVLQVGTLDPSLAEALASKYQSLQLPDGSDRDWFLAEHGGSVTVVVTSGPPGVDDTLMTALPKLGAVVSYGVGYDRIDVGAARRRGIGVSNTPDVLTDSVADTAVGLILSTVRGFGAADRYLREGRWETHGAYPLTRDVNGTQVGILGLGRIGTAIATRLLGFDCAIAYHNRTRFPTRRTAMRPPRPSWRSPSTSSSSLRRAARAPKSSSTGRCWKPSVQTGI